MLQGKAKTYARVMLETLDGVSEAEAKKRIKRLKLLLYKRRDAKHVSHILREFARAWKERNGKIAMAQSAQALLEKTKTEMAKSLEKKGYVLEERVDPAVIGGTALYLGNEYVIDSTVKGKLQRMAKMFNIVN